MKIFRELRREYRDEMARKTPEQRAEVYGGVAVLIGLPLGVAIGLLAL